ncbi:DUF1499 domain-containing protein [Parasalinivibrio latis]
MERMKINQLCSDKPNCVSTIESREQFSLSPFRLKTNDINAIKEIALRLPGARLAEESEGYLRIECVSKIMRFVDDLELKIDNGNLVVRSESRVGYSDFGVNRKRAETLRTALREAGITE